MNSVQNTNVIYLIYDGECLICRHSAQALRIKNSVGQLQTINARTNHELVNEVEQLGYDLNEGMIVKYHEQLYYGSDAVHLLALLSSHADWFNKLNAFLFKYKTMTIVTYPVFKTMRKLLLWMRNTPKILRKSKSPVFQSIFGDKWKDLPQVLKSRYGNHAFCSEVISMKGHLSIKCSKMFSFFAPLMRLSGAQVPYEGENIPVTVVFKSQMDSKIISMQRTFYYPDKNSHEFHSRLLPIKNNLVAELTRFGFGVRMFYQSTNNKVLLEHKGYVWRAFGILIPMPLTFLLGRVTAKEEALSDNSFNMQVKISHPLFGEMLEYSGLFVV